MNSGTKRTRRISVPFVLVVLLTTALSSPTSEASQPSSQTCSAHVAFVVDTSASIQLAGAENPDYIRSAMKSMVGALSGTDSTIDIITFRAQSTMQIRNASTLQSVQPIDGQIDAIDFSGGSFTSNSGTNWEAGLQAARGLGAQEIVLLTDGLPNLYGSKLDHQVRGNDATIDFDPAALGAAKTVADGLRNEGASIRAVGVGKDVRVASLQAVAGTTSGRDYFVGDFSGLTKLIGDAATNTCGSRLVLRDTVDHHVASQRSFDISVNGKSKRYTTNEGGVISLPLPTDGAEVRFSPSAQDTLLASAECTADGNAVDETPDYKAGAITLPKVAARVIECSLDERSGTGDESFGATPALLSFFHLDDGAIERKQKTVDDVPLWVRGYIKYECMYALQCSGNERIAQVVALHFAAVTIENRAETTKYVDWEVSDSRARRKGTKFADIMTHLDNQTWNVSEVKEYKGPATRDQVEAQLSEYITFLSNTADRNDEYISVQKDTRYIGFYAKFRGKPDWKGDQDTYVEWSPEPGHVYFRKEDDMKKSKDPVQKQIVEEAKVYMKEHDMDTQNGWDDPLGGGPGSGFHVPLVPRTPTPVPVPVAV